MAESLEKKSVPEMLKGRELFITGVTGFVGKVLLEKLLRCCPEIQHIHVLMRSTEKRHFSQRLRLLFEEMVFDRVRNECPERFSKVTPVPGDVALDFCGLNETDIEKMSKFVSVVLHCAANVRFDETLRRSIAVNVEGVKNVLEVCHKLTCLEALVHVSTAYAFCHKDPITEEVFKEVVTPEELLSVCKWMDDEELSLLFKTVKLGRPSTYHFSKAIAETLIQEECTKSNLIPVCIVRPSIVTAAWKEPFPGWVDTNNGPSGLIAACGKGLVKSIHAPADIIADFVPVDVVVNTILVAARNLLVARGLCKYRFDIVNCTSNKVNPLTWGGIQKIVLPLMLEHPSMTLYRYPGGSFKNSSFAHRLSMIVDHMIPAYLLEMASYVTLRPFKAIKVYKKINNVLNHLEYFTTNQFNFHCDNYFQLIDEMTEEDCKVFYVDIQSLNWVQYFKAYVPGVRKFLLREREETIPEAIKRMNRIYYTFLAFKVSIICCSAWVMYWQKALIAKAISKMLALLAKPGALIHGSVGKFLKLQ